MSENKIDKEMKDIVNQLVNSLKSQGISVDGAAVLKLGSKDSDKKEPTSEDINELIKQTLDKLRDKAQNSENQDTTGQEDEKCYCSNCFNFETFEEILKDGGGNFDYQEIVLGGNTFDIKYWSDGGLKENLMIKRRQVVKGGLTDEQKLENLYKSMDEAISNKNFSTAQIVLNEIFKLKSKKQN